MKGRRSWWVAVIVGAAGVATACSSPNYTYIANSAEQTYVKIPSTWHQISPDQIDAVTLQSPAGSATRELEKKSIWAVGYDSASDPTADHLFGNVVDKPSIFISVQQLPASAQGQWSLDAMRNLFWPLTPDARSAAEQAAQQQGSTFPFVEVLRDEVKTPAAHIHGVHEVFDYRIGATPMQTVNQVVYVSDDGRRLYLLLVRSSAEYFQAHKAELEGIVNSFTVKGQQR